MFSAPQQIRRFRCLTIVRYVLLLAVLAGCGQKPTQLDKLRRFGVRLAFDDFGTGFASLNLLRTFPVTHIKIDKSFTQLMNISDKDRVIVTSLIQMAKELGLEVVAEGVENEAAAEFLRSQNCETGQGFFYGKPVPPAVFAEAFLLEGAERKLA